MILCNVHRMIVLVVSAICVIRYSDGVLDDDQKESIRDYFEDVVECMDIPGLQFSLVQNGVTEMTLAVGKADIENDVAMTTETPMVLASVTKGIFTLTLSKLLHEHPTYTWDTSVREILGDWFYMNNWELTNHMTLKDLVSHRTGMPRQDLIPVYYNWDRLELIKHYRYIEPTEPFRTEYMYANIPYVIAGYIAEVIGERPWEESLQMFFLDPLGMNSTTIWSLDNEDLMDSAAYSYVQVHGERRKVERGSYAQGYQFGAAGYMTSTSEDMAIWTQFLLAGGVTPDDVALIDPVAFAEVFRPETGRSQDPWLSPPNDPFLYTIGDVYAKGFTIGSYRGYKIIQHAGGIPNFNNLQLLFPDIDAGLFISMTIQEYARMYDMSSFVLDTVLGETPYRTAEATCASYAASDPEGFVFDLPEAPAARDLEDYVGTFGSDAAGNAYVTLENGTLYMKYGRLPGRYEMLSTVAPNVFKGNSTTLESGVFGFIPIGFISSEGNNGVLDVMRIFDQVNFYRDRPLADTSKPLEPLTGECEVCEECEQFNHAATAFSTFSTFSLVIAVYVLYLFA